MTSIDLVVCTSDYDHVNKHVYTWTKAAQGDHRVTVIGDAPKDGGAGLESICISEDGRSEVWVVPFRNRLGPVRALQEGFERTDAPIIAFIHDDVIIHEPGWDKRVLAEFEDPTVGVVGFGGATGLGTPGIYKTPYRLQQLARIAYASNVDDAEAHGRRFAGERDVAVLDGFSLIARRCLLEDAGGWPVDRLMFHMYDAWLGCMAARFGYRTRLVGVRCVHLGGRTSTRTPYNAWLQSEHGKTDADIHREAHEWIYDEFRDVLPLRATEGQAPAKATALNA